MNRTKTVNSVALIIIYNHQHDKNIEVVERIYSDRFSHIYHLVPFYKGDKHNVIPVYENSYYFQGYVAQGLKSIIDKNFTHYFFVADDLILNPNVNQRNYTQHLKLDSNSSFLPGFIQLHERKVWWSRVGEAYRWTLQTKGVEVENQLPSYEDAFLAFDRFGLTLKPLRFNQIWKTPKTIRDFVRTAVNNRNYFARAIYGCLKSYNLPYPLVGSYSDIFVISSEAAKDFAHYCGVFAATRLFVEIAIPTSMVLSASKIVTEKDLDLRGRAIWDNSDLRATEDQYEKQLAKLLSDFPRTNLYLHPIKLSRWKT